MPRGIKPIPAEVRSQRGETSAALPVVIGGRVAPDMPAHFTEDMRLIWNTIVVDLMRADVIDKADAGVIEAATVIWARARQARAELAVEMKKSKSLLETTPQGRIPNRLLTVERDSWREFRALAESLPLSPWGRARLGLKSKTAGAGAEVEIGLPPRLLHASGE